MIVGGVVLVAALSLVTEGAFAVLQRVAVSPGLRTPAATYETLAPTADDMMKATSAG